MSALTSAGRCKRDVKSNFVCGSWRVCHPILSSIVQGFPTTDPGTASFYTKRVFFLLVRIMAQLPIEMIICNPLHAAPDTSVPDKRKGSEISDWVSRVSIH